MGFPTVWTVPRALLLMRREAPCVSLVILATSPLSPGRNNAQCVQQVRWQQLRAVPRVWTAVQDSSPLQAPLRAPSALWVITPVSQDQVRAVRAPLDTTLQ